MKKERKRKDTVFGLTRGLRKLAVSNMIHQYRILDKKNGKKCFLLTVKLIS